MLTQLQSIKAFLVTLEKEIQANIKSKGKQATGKTGAAIHVKRIKRGWSLLGPEHIQALESGRGPTKGGRGPGPTLQQAVLKWIKAKNITSELSDVSLSWAISKSLHAKGDKLHQQRRRSGVLSEVINKERLARFVGLFSAQEAIRLSSEITRHWQSLGK